MEKMETYQKVGLKRGQKRSINIGTRFTCVTSSCIKKSYIFVRFLKCILRLKYKTVKMYILTVDNIVSKRLDVNIISDQSKVYTNLRFPHWGKRG